MSIFDMDGYPDNCDLTRLPILIVRARLRCGRHVPSTNLARSLGCIGQQIQSALGQIDGAVRFRGKGVIARQSLHVKANLPKSYHKSPAIHGKAATGLAARSPQHRSH